MNSPETFVIPFSKLEEINHSYFFFEVGNRKYQINHIMNKSPMKTSSSFSA